MTNRAHPFSADEDAKILRLLRGGRSSRTVAFVLERDPRTIEKRIEVLQKVPDQPRRRCRCGAAVANEPHTDYRFCQQCRRSIADRASLPNRFAAAS